MRKELGIRTGQRNQFLNITSEVRKAAAESGIIDGICTVYVPHTTAGVTINEAADPSVVNDILMELNKIVPAEDGYKHSEGNSAAHIKATLVGSSAQIPMEGGKLLLGTWQGVFFCEFDGPRNRRISIVISGS